MGMVIYTYLSYFYLIVFSLPVFAGTTNISRTENHKKFLQIKTTLKSADILKEEAHVIEYPEFLQNSLNWIEENLSQVIHIARLGETIRLVYF